MSNKRIFDYPELLNETLVSLSEACRCFPVQVSRASLERYIRRGIRNGDQNAALESVLVLGKRYTSLEAIQRFVRAQHNTQAERVPPKCDRMSKKEIEEASLRHGLPTT